MCHLLCLAQGLRGHLADQARSRPCSHTAACSHNLSGRAVGTSTLPAVCSIDSCCCAVLGNLSHPPSLVSCPPSVEAPPAGVANRWWAQTEPSDWNFTFSFPLIAPACSFTLDMLKCVHTHQSRSCQKSCSSEALFPPSDVAWDPWPRPEPSTEDCPVQKALSYDLQVRLWPLKDLEFGV